MAEKNILAYFKTPQEAEEAQSKLKSLQVVDMRLDQIGQFPGEGVETPMNPITGNFSSLAELTMGAEITNKSAGILVSADGSASGMSDRGSSGLSGYNHLLTIVVDDSIFERAVRTVESCGGKV